MIGVVVDDGDVIRLVTTAAGSTNDHVHVADNDHVDDAGKRFGSPAGGAS